MNVAVDGERLRRDIERNGSFGATEGPGRGRTNLTGSGANREARDYLVDRLEAAGLDVTVDAVGNVRGRWVPAGADPSAAPVAAGSHLDSVPEGGIFDGPLGVYAALEAVRALQESSGTIERPVEVVSFTEEEGTRFGGGLLGSSVAAGKRDPEDALQFTDEDGTTLAEALEGIGYRGSGTMDASSWDAWVELHVEQHTRLEEAGASVGVVTTITGITHLEATIRGAADHAGATPMADRTDALAGAAEFVLDIERIATEKADQGDGTAVGTVGRLDVRPNATNVVPGSVEAGVDVRDVEPGTVDAIVSSLRDRLERIGRERGLATALERGLDLPPTPLSDRVRGAANTAATDADTSAIDLHSGAAHDTMHVASVTDAGMLFAPSREGISHSPREWTDWEDCTAATRVLAGTIARLAGHTSQ